MLTTLRIKNLALVSDLTLELQPGCNVITGETGAGKSILIGALSLILGDRADRNLIRSGAEQCTVEAVFDIRKLRVPLKTFLEENGLEPCEDHQIVLKRSFSISGSNRQFINGSPTTLNMLGTIGEWLVDIHGPHDHQSLLHPAKQLAILDAFGGLHGLRGQFADALKRRAAVEAEKTCLVVDEKTYAQQVDLLRFQVNEISAAKLQPEEETDVEQEYKRTSNASKLLELSHAALGILSEDEVSLTVQAGALGRTVQELVRLDPGAACLASLHEQAAQAIRDLQSELSDYADKIDVDPSRLREIEARLDLLHSLKRKYGSSVAEVITFGEEAQTKLHSLEQRDAELVRLNTEIAKINAELRRIGSELTAQRKKVIPKLCKAAMKHLNDLGFKQSIFDITVETVDPGAAKGSTGGGGFDSIDFQFSPNRGEPLRPLRAIASSGEMARVMLALKTVLAAEDEIPVLVFDEVDANVGGETATTVGDKMLEIARQRQVLCITHLAPVAACASTHYVVTKQLKENRTISEITLLNESQRVTEIARMLGGQSDAARKHAQSLLKAR